MGSEMCIRDRVILHLFKCFKKTTTVSDVYKISLVIYLITSSVIFSSIHSHDNWGSFLIYTLSGLVWAIAYVWSKTLLVPIVITIGTSNVLDHT